MNVPMMTMDPRIANIHYQDYHKKVLEARTERRRRLTARGQEIGAEIARLKIEKTRLEKEDEELMAAYQAMAKGKRILNLPGVLRAAGAQPDTFFPKLAVARADWKQCHFRIRDSFAWYTEDEWIGYSGKPGPRAIQVGRQVFPAETWNEHWRREHGKGSYPLRALVPAVPAHLRPAHLEKFHILWEAEWAPRAPGDPILLKRISGSLFVVVAQWDLSPIEQCILEGRLG